MTYRPLLLASIAMLLSMSSCLNDDEDNKDYKEWREKNTKYVADAEALTENGAKVYTRITPPWAPDLYVLMKWHNDRSLTLKNLSPLDNSVVNIKYELESIDGDKWSDSYSSTVYGDSIYQSRPMNNIVGMWAAMTNMHVGDSVTIIMPYNTGYGSTGSGEVLPYSTLIYHVKMTGIPAYEVPK